MSKEGRLWETALAYYGHAGLQQTVVDLWKNLEPLTRHTVEYLTRDQVGTTVFEIGATVNGRDQTPDKIAIYSEHAGDLVDAILSAIPPRALPFELRGDRLEDDFGM
jgi:hypothetical protein